MSIIDSIRLSGTTYQIQVTVDAALDSGSTNPVANSAITTALDDKVNVVDNEVPDYNVTSQITYQGGYPSQSETASTWDSASMFTLRYNFFNISDTNYTTTAAVIDPSGNITTGSVATDENGIGNPLPDYIDMVKEVEIFVGAKYYFTAKEGYRIAHLDIYSSRFGSYETIIEERAETVFEGGQSADVIKDVIEPTLINKQDQLVSGTNIKTINNTSILGSGNIDIQGGGKAIEAGRGIAITTGETADTVSISLPISAGTGTNSIREGDSTQAYGPSSHAEGQNTRAYGSSSHAEGTWTKAGGGAAHAEGSATEAYGDCSHTEGWNTTANNQSEHASGQYNISNSATTEFGDSGNTLFSVGNGTDDDARHNAFEIRQNGDIYLSSGGTDIKLQDHLGGSSITVDTALDSGSTNPVANSAITTALDDKVNVADNNASAYTFEDKIGDAQHEYSEHFAGPIYIKYTGPSSSSGNNHYAGTMTYYISESASEPIDLYFNLSNGQITATTVSSDYFDIEIENGEAAITFKDGYYLRRYYSQNNFVALTKTTYESGQSADVIEDTVYDVFDKLNDKIDKTSANVVTGSSLTFRDGYLNSYLNTNKTSLFSSVKIDSSTIKSSDNGLSVQFATSEVGDKILNVGSGSYGTLFSTDSYNTSFNEFTITFNPNCTQYGVYYFSVRIIDASNAMHDVAIEYDSSDMSAVYTYLNTYCTVTDTLPTDYKLKVTAKEGYKIALLHNGNYMVGGVDNTNPNNYISNLVTTPSYVHDGQDVIDGIYDKLDDKQDTLVSGTNIKTINNQSLLGSGNINIQGGGGKAIEAGRGITITTGETADTVSFNLPISAGTGTNSVAEGNGTTARGRNSHAEGDYTTAAGMYSHAEGSDTYALGESSHSEGDSTIANGDYSHTEGYQTTANNQSEHASGRFNVSSSASTTFGDSGNTLFSVGNGTADLARHNAFEIRQNGDIYLSSGGTDIKLQDHLGGGGGLTEDDELLLATALTDLNDRKIDASEVKSKYQKKGDYVTTNTLNTRLAEYETALDEQNVEEVTAYALNDLNERFGGLKIVKITESEYEALTTKDENTLYVVVADPS